MLPKPGARGIIVEMKAALFGLADGVYSPQQCKRSLCKRDLMLGKRNEASYSPSAWKLCLGSFNGIKDHSWSCCSPGPAADEIADPWTTSKFEYPASKLLNLSSLIYCTFVSQCCKSELLQSHDPSEIFQLEISIFSSISCTQL